MPVQPRLNNQLDDAAILAAYRDARQFGAESEGDCSKHGGKPTYERIKQMRWSAAGAPEVAVVRAHHINAANASSQTQSKAA